MVGELALVIEREGELFTWSVIDAAGSRECVETGTGTSAALAESDARKAAVARVLRLREGK